VIEVGVVDLGADGRRRLIALVERWGFVNPDARHITLPRLSIRSLSPDELKFNGALDVCIVGPDIIAADPALVSNIRKQIPNQIVLCVLDTRTYSFALIEQLGRLGVDDVLMDTASGDEFYRRLILLRRRLTPRERGRLIIVDGARGGVGCTFVAAGLADSYVSSGLRTCVVDCDVVSQDLTRFLQCQPYINEPLKMLLDQQRMLSVETVQEATCRVWENEPLLFCMPPPAACDQGLFASPPVMRTFVGLLEVLSQMMQVVIVDGSSMIASMRQAFFQIADEVVLVLNRDPSGVVAHRQALSSISASLKQDGILRVVVNDNGIGRLPISGLEELISVASGDAAYVIVPFNRSAALWACSGNTPYRLLATPFEQLTGSDPINKANSDRIKWPQIFPLIQQMFRPFVTRRKVDRGFAENNKPSLPKIRKTDTRLPALVVAPSQGEELVTKATLIN